MSTSVAQRVLVSIAINQQDLDKTVAQTKNKFDNLFDVAMGNIIANAVGNMAKGVANAVSEIAIAGAEYNALFNTIQVASNESVESMKAVEQLTFDLGNATKFSSQEVLDSIRMWQKNGRDIEEALDGGIEASLKFAQTTGSDLTGAVDLATDLMSLYGDEVMRQVDLTQLLVGVTEESKIQGRDIGQVFRQSAVSARIFGGDIETLAGIIATTDTNFNTANTQATALKRTFEDIRNRRDIFDDLGIDVVGDDDQYRNLRDILEDVNNLVSSQNLDGREDLINELFGNIESRAGIRAILDNFHELDGVLENIQAKDVEGLLNATITPFERLNSFLETTTIRFSRLEIAGVALSEVLNSSFSSLMQPVQDLTNLGFDLLQTSLDQLGERLPDIENAINDFTNTIIESDEFNTLMNETLGISLESYESLSDFLINEGVDSLIRFIEENEDTIISLIEFINVSAELIDENLPLMTTGLGLLIDTFALVRQSLGLLNVVFNSSFRAILDYISNTIKTGKRLLNAFREKDLLEAFTEIFNLLIGNSFTFGHDLIGGIIGGLQGQASRLYDTMRGIARRLFNVFREENDINSPSQLYYDTATEIPNGIRNSLDDSQDDIIDSMIDLATVQNTSYSNAIDKSYKSVNNTNNFNIRSTAPQATAKEIEDLQARQNRGAFSANNLIIV